MTRVSKLTHISNVRVRREEGGRGRERGLPQSAYSSHTHLKLRVAYPGNDPLEIFFVREGLLSLGIVYYKTGEGLEGLGPMRGHWVINLKCKSIRNLFRIQEREAVRRRVIYDKMGGLSVKLDSKATIRTK